jgi:alpha-tubulin suppressor-like RCC1 family protein
VSPSRPFAFLSQSRSVVFAGLAFALAATATVVGCNNDGRRLIGAEADCSTYCDYVTSVCGVAECSQAACESSPTALKDCLINTGGSTCDALDYEVATCKRGGAPAPTATVPNGGPCATSNDCQSGVCNPSGVCGFLPAGTACAKDGDCRSGVCNSKKVCGAAPDGNACVENRDCSTGLCNASKTCGPEPVRCTSGQACADGVCTSSGTCGAKKDGQACGVDTDCKTGFCNSAKTCGKSANGLPCTQPADCTANVCNSVGTCGKNADGKPCKAATDCTSAICNAAGTCGNLPLGQPCTTADQCASNYCRGTTCGNNILQLAAGGDHTCAVEGSGRVFCWGRNDDGQAGTGCTTSLCTSAMRMPSFTQITVVAAGNAHTCALRAGANSVYCWGKNDKGQLGDGSGITQREPVKVALPGAAVLLTSGEDHACAALVDGGVYCWGRNDFGQLGDGSQTNRPTPVRVGGLPAGLLTWKQIASRSNHTCLVQDGSNALYCWGDNRTGQVGAGGAAVTSATRIPLTTGPNITYLTASAVSPGVDHTCAESNGVQCWGSNTALQLGRGVLKDPQTMAVLTQAPPGYTTPRITSSKLSAGNQFTCAQVGGALQCWGVNGVGQLEDGTTVAKGVPTAATSIGNFSDLSVGRAHGCALRPADPVLCWGDAASGQLGDGRSGAGLSATKGVPVQGL